eukprot:COSAG01_NODE_94_length_26962_cov_9.110933_30_plen_171_part_00
MPPGRRFQTLSTDRLVVVTAVLSEPKSAPHRHLVVDSRRQLGVLLEPWHGRALMPDAIHQHGVAVLGQHRCRFFFFFFFFFWCGESRGPSASEQQSPTPLIPSHPRTLRVRGKLRGDAHVHPTEQRTRRWPSLVSSVSNTHTSCSQTRTSCELGLDACCARESHLACCER